MTSHLDASSSAEVSSLASSLSEMTRRIDELASARRAAGDEESFLDLLAVEKSLESAARRLDRMHRRA